VLLLVGFGVALVATAGLVKLHDEILKASFEQRDLVIQSWVHGFTRPWLTEVMLALSWIGSPAVLTAAVTLVAGLPSDVAGGYLVGAVWLAAVIGSDLWVERPKI
jgi:hypothetical protein